jgi:6-pyruvoyltetrahydropterin/6-carboxytetrahydropterin synthase
VTYQISKRFAFSASHQLAGLRDGHPCGRLHGHNYEVEVRLVGESLDVRGFLLDYGDLAPVKEWIDGTLDHRHLNDVLGFQPTAENLAAHLSEVVYECVSVPMGVDVVIGVSETPKTWAWFTP